MRRNARLAVAGVTTAALVVPLGLALAAQSATAAEPNLAAGKPATASSTVDVYGAGNVTDGNQGTYWESVNNQFPQWVQVDLGSAATVTDLTLKLPTGAWGTRTQTITVQGSTNGSTFSTLKNQAGYTFDPGQANTVNVDVTDTSVRYVRLSITGNTGWPAGQLSELEVHGTSDPDPHPDHPDTTTPRRPPARTSPSAGPSSRRRPSGPTPRPTPSTGTSAPTGRAAAASTRATSR